jgi:hypothetical protein
MIPKKLALDVIGGGYRFSDKIMPKQKTELGMLLREDARRCRTNC